MSGPGGRYYYLRACTHYGTMLSPLVDRGVQSHHSHRELVTWLLAPRYAPLGMPLGMPALQPGGYSVSRQLISARARAAVPPCQAGRARPATCERTAERMMPAICAKL